MPTSAFGRTSISPRDLAQFTKFRMAVELQVAEAAAECATLADVDKSEFVTAMQEHMVVTLERVKMTASLSSEEPQS